MPTGYTYKLMEGGSWLSHLTTIYYEDIVECLILARRRGYKGGYL